MCYLCQIAGRDLRPGPLTVAATDISGRPMLYAHQQCINEEEAKINASMDWGWGKP